ncbi:MAG: hypothetical protein INR69_07770 [Mucilaginibacter polytrichastri]|nr:hypothetical protein [Mucilaginibacter polytrichastri]
MIEDIRVSIFSGKLLSLVVSKKITLPKIESNVRYYVTGKFFGTGTNDGFTVGVDKTWRPDQNVHF